MYQKYDLIHLNLLTLETERNELTLPDFSADVEKGQTVLTGIDVLDGQLSLLAGHFHAAGIWQCSAICYLAKMFS